MPDLTREVYYLCTTGEYWEMDVPNSKGDGTYIVRYDNLSHKNRRSVQYDYSCTCMAYKNRKGYCKHIEQAKKHHCNWHQFMDGGDVGRDKNGNKCCPKCGASVTTQVWMV